LTGSQWVSNFLTVASNGPSEIPETDESCKSVLWAYSARDAVIIK